MTLFTFSSDSLCLYYNSNAIYYIQFILVYNDQVPSDTILIFSFAYLIDFNPIRSGGGGL